MISHAPIPNERCPSHAPTALTWIKPRTAGIDTLTSGPHRRLDPETIMLRAVLIGDITAFQDIARAGTPVMIQVRNAVTIPHNIASHW